MMKKRFYIGILALLVGSAACSDEGHQTIDKSKRIVSLQVGVYPQTRANLSTLDGQRVAFCKGTVSCVYTETWEAVAHASDTRIEGDHIYPEDRSYLYLRGYFPVAPMAGGQAVYSLDGQTDVLATIEQKGSFVDNFTVADKTFYFHHLLTQCSFAVGLVSPASGTVRIKSLQVNGSRPQVAVRLMQAKADTLPQVAFTGNPVQLPVYMEPGRNEGIVLSEEPSQLPQSVLVEPGAQLTLDMELSFAGSETKIYKGLPLHFNEADGLSLPGTAYLITIRVHPPGTPGTGEISLGVSVTPWQAGTGAGTIE